ncbi:MAG TPA: hypothetical protein VEL74_18265 [Thermoanaerobaculia bacterium]|nr:hypothetical protein [Thermoanaerobaculia bacterium]
MTTTLTAYDDPAVAAALPRVHERFLEFALRRPEYLDPASFVLLGQKDGVLRHPMEGWPLFIGREQAAALGRAAVGIARVAASIPRRVFELDPERMAEFYRLPRELVGLTVSLMAKNDPTDGAIGRGDFILAPSGLKCCEANMAGNLGGSELGDWTERYLREPLVRRFMEHEGLVGSYTDPPRVLFHHILDEAEERGVPEDGRLNAALLVSPSPPEWRAHFQRVWQSVLADRGGAVEGELAVCGDAELRERGGRLFLGDLRIDVVVDASFGQVARHVFVALQAGRVRAYNGPATPLLSDKLNLALASEMADSGLFTDEERRVIRDHLPWTRRVEDGFADFEGERVYLPDLLADRRERLILKHSLSSQGSDVHAGAFTPPARWEELVRAALDDGLWIVQEFMPPTPIPFLLPEGGAADHEVVWGLYIIGERYGGGFLRVQPAGRAGVINSARGALCTCIIEVDE